MRKLLFVAFALTMLTVSCKKNSTPDKVVKRITVGTWYIAKMIDSTVNRTPEMKNLNFIFQSDRKLTVEANEKIDGAWSVPVNQKKPAQLIIYVPDFDVVKPVSDDWIVTFITKEEFRLERLNGKKAENDELIFRKK
jgi:hypothetical protein